MTSNLTAVLRNAAIVYCFTFVFGLATAIAGVTLQNNPSTAYVTNLLSGALGFTVVGTRMSTHRAQQFAWVAATMWTFNLTNIIFGVQTSAGWIHSGLTILLMAVLGEGLAIILTLSPQPNGQHVSPPQIK